MPLKFKGKLFYRFHIGEIECLLEKQRPESSIDLLRGLYEPVVEIGAESFHQEARGIRRGETGRPRTHPAVCVSFWPR